MTVTTHESQAQPAPAHDTDPLQVLFLAGLGRSGSTIVANVLGQHPDAVSVGEVVHLWTRGLADNELCGCARPLRECEFWSEVGKAAFGGWDQIDLVALTEQGHRIDRNRYLPLMIKPGMKAGRAQDQSDYTNTLIALYRAIRSVSGARVIVDSTKHVSYAYLLSMLPEFDLRVAHLVRESQGVAHSWAKVVERPEVTNGSAEMPRYSPAQTSGKWITYNGLLHGLRALGTPRQLVRYEDIIGSPELSFRQLAHFAGLDAEPMESLVGPDWVELSPTHTVAGNPSRFQHGRVDLRLDRAWVEAMPERDRRIVTALTWPLSRAYGYHGRTLP